MADETLTNFSFPDIKQTDYIDESLEWLKQRDNASRISFRVMNNFPSPVTAEDIGMAVYRPDLKASFRLVRVVPDPYWQQLTKEDGTPVTQEELIAGYQPLNASLTSLLNIPGEKDHFPYLSEKNTYDQTPLTLFARTLLSKLSAAEIRQLLEIKSAALLDTPIDGAYIKDGTVKVDKIDLSTLSEYLPTTGVCWPTYATEAPPGWILADDGTIGSATSGASNASNDTKALFALLWNLSVTEVLTVTGAPSSKSSTYLIDWNANKRLTVPKLLGRALACSGAGAGITARYLGQIAGEEKHKLTIAEMPSHTHSTSIRWGKLGVGGGQSLVAAGGVTGAAGGDQPFNILPPTSYINFQIKL